MKLVLFSCIAILALAQAAPFFTQPANFWAQLTGNGNNGLCNGYYGLPGTTGTNVGVKNPAYTRKLWVYCVHDIIGDSVTAAHLHGPAGPQSAGNPVYTFNLNSQNQINGQSGTTFQSGFDIISENSERLLFSGQYYVNVHTTAFGGGRIRGQFYPIGFPTAAFPTGVTEPTHLAYLDDTQEVPASTIANTTRAAIIHIRRSGSNLNLNAVWTNLEDTVTGTIQFAHFHLPSPAAGWPNTGAVLTTICGSAGACGSGSGSYYTTYSVVDNDPTNTDAGNVYANYHTTNFGAGLLRGQVQKGVKMIQARFYGDDQPNFYAMMDGSQAGTSATGMALGYYNPGTRELRVYAVHNSALATTAAHVHGPASLGHDGGVVCGMFTSTSSFWYTAAPNCVLTAAQEGWLYNGLLYVNFHNTMFPNGEVRGQLWDMNHSGAPTHAALINDLQAGPTVTPKNANRGGIAFFTCGSPTTSTSTCTGNFMWAGLSSVPSAAHVHGPPAAGAVDPTAFAQPGNPSNLAVASTICTGTGAQACTNGAATSTTAGTVLNPTLTFTPFQNSFDYYYVNVHTTLFGNGEIRGQVRALAAPPTRQSAGMDNANFYAIANNVLSGAGGGFGLCVATYKADSATLTYQCTHTCTSPTLAHFHGPCAAGQFNCGVWKTLTSDVTATNQYLYRGQVTGITATEWTNLNGGMYYWNVHTAQFGSGCATGTLYPAGQGVTGMIPTHSAIMDGLQDGFGPTIYTGGGSFGDPNYLQDAGGIALIMVGASSVTSWQAWSGIGSLPTGGGHIHGPNTIAPLTAFTENINPPFQVLDTTSATVTANYANTTNTFTLTGSQTAYLTAGTAYVNLHITGGAYANGVIRGQVTPVQPLPVGTVTPPPPSSSTGGSSGPTGSATTATASFFVVALLAMVAALFQ